MRIPESTIYLRCAVWIWGGYALLWIALEGALAQVVALAVGTTAVVLLYALSRLRGRRFGVALWVGGTAVVGIIAGAVTVGLTLMLMALKTGLHAHGPEFTPGEIRWVAAQLSLWSTAGSVLGIGTGLLTAGLWRD